MSPIRSSPLNLEKYRFAPAGARVSSPNIISFSAAASRKNETVQIDKETILPVPGQNVGHDCTADGVEGNGTYPSEKTKRETFKTKEGKVLTAYRWAVYDFVRKIPAGKVTTYKEVCSALGSGSPRSVGSALRNNPFAPIVPCHRVIASTGYIGGFLGEWNDSAHHNQGKHVRRKIELLSEEGVRFTDKGYLIGEEMIWRESD